MSIEEMLCSKNSNKKETLVITKVSLVEIKKLCGQVQLKRYRKVKKQLVVPNIFL